MDDDRTPDAAAEALAVNQPVFLPPTARRPTGRPSEVIWQEFTVPAVPGAIIEVWLDRQLYADSYGEWDYLDRSDASSSVFARLHRVLIRTDNSPARLVAVWDAPFPSVSLLGVESCATLDEAQRTLAAGWQWLKQDTVRGPGRRDKVTAITAKDCAARIRRAYRTCWKVCKLATPSQKHFLDHHADEIGYTSKSGFEEHLADLRKHGYYWPQSFR